MDVCNTAFKIVDFLESSTDYKNFQTDTEQIIWREMSEFLNIAWYMRKYQNEYLLSKDKEVLKQVKQYMQRFDEILASLTAQRNANKEKQTALSFFGINDTKNTKEL